MIQSRGLSLRLSHWLMYVAACLHNACRCFVKTVSNMYTLRCNLPGGVCFLLLRTICILRRTTERHRRISIAFSSFLVSPQKDNIYCLIYSARRRNAYFFHLVVLATLKTLASWKVRLKSMSYVTWLKSWQSFSAKHSVKESKPEAYQAHSRGPADMTSLDGDERFSGLVAWSQSQGGKLHEAAEIYRDDVTQVSLRVRSRDGQECQLESGDVVVFCPLSTTLSFLNALTGGQPLGSSSPDQPGPTPGRLTFPDSFLEQVPPHVVGRFFLMQQYLMGQESHWYAYIASLPQPEHVSAWSLPAMWPRHGDNNNESGPALLEGTNAGIAAAEMQKNLSQEYRQARRLLQSAVYPALADFTRLLYHWAFCIFTSRSFRPSLVLSAEAQADLRADEGTDSDQCIPRLPSGCKIDDFSILLPVLDLANHDPTARAIWEATSAGPASGGVSNHEAASVGGSAFRIQQRYASGQQVFNNYGMKTNSELLLGYGFVLPPTVTLHNDYVHLRKRGEQAAVAGTEAGTGPPRDFLLSLRPLDDPSSVVGAARQWPRRTTQAGSLPSAFSRFEDALLWDLCSQMWTEADRQQVLGPVPRMEVSVDTMPLEQRTAVLDRVFATASPDGLGPFAELEDRARQTLFAKVAMDYERLVEGEQYVDEEEDVDADERENWQLAQAYRQQYGAVLINALKALDPDVELVEAA